MNLAGSAGFPAFENPCISCISDPTFAGEMQKTQMHLAMDDKNHV